MAEDLRVAGQGERLQTEAYRELDVSEVYGVTEPYAYGGPQLIEENGKEGRRLTKLTYRTRLPQGRFSSEQQYQDHVTQIDALNAILRTQFGQPFGIDLGRGEGMVEMLAEYCRERGVDEAKFVSLEGLRRELQQSECKDMIDMAFKVTDTIKKSKMDVWVVAKRWETDTEGESSVAAKLHGVTVIGEGKDMQLVPVVQAKNKQQSGLFPQGYETLPYPFYT